MKKRELKRGLTAFAKLIQKPMANKKDLAGVRAELSKLRKRLERVEKKVGLA